MSTYNDPCCHHCGHECKVMQDKHVGGYVSFCHGVGFDYVDEDDNDQTENEGLEYLPEWDN